jgi:uncharacterized protein
MSPCVNICKLDPKSQYCVGCLRSLEEIANWSSFSQAEKELVLTSIFNYGQQRFNLHCNTKSTVPRDG